VPTGGFGLGALNDADDDDLDVYDHSQVHGRNRHAYDANDAHDEERVVMSSRSQGVRDLAKATQPQVGPHPREPGHDGSAYEF
jgi:G patch domain-containing protein 1